jgi:twinkle protein
MQTEINGFKIDRFNVHGIKEGATTASCPECSEHRKPQNQKQKCMSVFWDTGLGQCNHCGETVQIHTYKRKGEVNKYNLPKPKENYSLVSDQAKAYFENRGISETTLKDLKITTSTSWMPKANKEIQVIDFNYFLNGSLINTKSRGKNKDFKFEKGCEIILYNIDAILNSSTCVLVEGEPDAAAYHESGVKNVSSVPNGFTLPRGDGSSTIQTGYLDNYYQIFENKEKVYLAFDNDVAGNEGQKEFIRRIGAERCFIVDFNDCKDANEYLLKHGKEELANTIATAKQVPLEDVIQINDLQEELIDFWENGAPRGKTIGLTDFDNVASFETKQYTLFLSAPGSGKSEFLDYVITKLAFRYGDKFGICSTENKPLKFHYDKIFKKVFGLRPSKDQIESEQVQKVFNFIQDHFIHVEKKNRYYLEDILAKFAELVKRKGCRYFILDPFNKIKLKAVSRSNVNEYTEEYHALLDEFCTKYDAHIFLVLHPNKLSRKRLSEAILSEKTFIMPTAYDAKGGGEHFDMSYNIIGMVRDFERDIVHIRTLKWKFQHLGEAGRDVYLKWNMKNGRYEPINGYFDESSTEIPSAIWDNRSWLETEYSEPLDDNQPQSANEQQDDFNLDEILSDPDCPY